MNERTAVVSRTNNEKVESVWNSRRDAEDHVRRFRMETDFETQPSAMTRETVGYAGVERRKRRAIR